MKFSVGLQSMRGQLLHAIGENRQHIREVYFSWGDFPNGRSSQLYSETYTPGQIVTYVVTLRNTGNTALTDLTVTDDLGGYDFNGTTVYPLTYEDGSVARFVNGVPQAAPAVTAGPPLTISGINIPAGGDVVLVYQARVNSFADPAAGGIIVNTVTVGVEADFGIPINGKCHFYCIDNGPYCKYEKQYDSGQKVYPRLPFLKSDLLKEFFHIGLPQMPVSGAVWSPK